MAYKAKNIFATLTLADFYHFGFGELDSNYTKAMKLYRKVIQSGNENSFYISHAYFNLGMMNQFGYGIDKNTTKATRFYNLSIDNEPNSYYPSLLMKYLIRLENSNIADMFLNPFYSGFNLIITPGLFSYGIITFVILYAIFFISLYYQKD